MSSVEIPLAAVPSAQARERSQTAYAGIGDHAALDIAQEELSDLLDAELVPELNLAPGESVKKYLGAYTAVLNEPGAPRGPAGVSPGLLVESTLPLRAPEGGGSEPIDATLEADGDHYEVGNAPVEAEIPSDLSDGVEMPGAEITVTPRRTETSNSTTVEGKVFYPNADRDTDYLIAPAATGAAIFLQLRSAESPERFNLDVAMPAGALLEARSDGGVMVRDDEETLVSVSAPIAWDASGMEVSTHFAFHGDTIELNVDHEGEDVLYPLAVDPVISDYYPFGANQPSPNYDMWQPISSGQSTWSLAYDQGLGGLRNRAHLARTSSGSSVSGSPIQFAPRMSSGWISSTSIARQPIQARARFSGFIPR